MESNHHSPARHAGVFAIGPRDRVSERGGSRTHKVTRLSTSSLCLFAYPAVCKLRVRGSHPAVLAYEAWMSTGPPASCRSRYRTGRTGRMKASWVPAHLQCSSDEGESRTRMPQGHDILNVACLPFHHFADVSSPYGNRTRITRMRVSYPEPLEERAVLSVRRAGVEPAQQSSGWVTATWARQCPADAYQK